MIAVDALPFAHLDRMSDAIGLYEHADHSEPRTEHGYCLDDVARALVVAVRGERDSRLAAALVEPYLAFVERAITPDGRAHNRRDSSGSWTDEAALGDWWGRAVHALGVTAAHADEDVVRRRARSAFDCAGSRRSHDLRAMASATIGAAEVLRVDPDDLPARWLVDDGAAAIPSAADALWRWPEPRLGYGNALIAEALLAAGSATEDPGLTRRGVDALTFLLERETRDGHLSVTGVGGRGATDTEAQFDQQPIEVAALADACARAASLGLAGPWEDGVRMAWAWFLGDNDTGIAMMDPLTGAGFDGLTREGRNANQGAESTLAALSTGQRMRELALARPAHPGR